MVRIIGELVGATRHIKLGVGGKNDFEQSRI